LSFSRKKVEGLLIKEENGEKSVHNPFPYDGLKIFRAKHDRVKVS